MVVTLKQNCLMLFLVLTCPARGRAENKQGGTEVRTGSQEQAESAGRPGDVCQSSPCGAC